jgi:hypothetical protein
VKHAVGADLELASALRLGDGTDDESQGKGWPTPTPSSGRNAQAIWKGKPRSND